MCGIAGILEFDPERPVDPRLLARMTDVLAHRGPDGRGTHVDGPLGLGHRRLAIIDLSEDAAQPMPNEDGSVWVVLNGEIYNFQSLREQLLAQGHRFRSRSDTEVLVHLYEELGEAFVERLRGMFALALWDAKERRLLLARDRFGQKPLYYRCDGESLRFGSEIKAILEDPAIPRVPDPDALHDYLSYGYVPGPRTAFRGIRKLPPAHTLTVEADGRQRLRRYWTLAMTPKGELLPGREDALFRELLRRIDEATRLRLISDVPLGAFLSGGVDSSTIVASMCSVSGGERVKTYAIGFDVASHDETAHAAHVARHLGTRHEMLRLESGALADLERIAWHYGEPFADASCLPTFAVSALARRHVTVALSGDGGDELFGGYRRYLGTHLEERVRGAGPLYRRAARSRLLIELLRRAGRRELSGELAHSRASTELGQGDLYLTRVESVAPRVKAALYSDSFRSDTRGRDARERLCRVIADSDGTTFTERCAHADALTYLPDDILVKVDVASMAHGLECRAPFLDHELAEFVARLPFPLKITAGGETKYALKQAVRHRLPPAILARPKMGFGVPLDTWFRGRLEETLRERLLDPRALGRGYFRADVLERLIGEHARGRQDHQNVLFSLLQLETWHRVWIDPPSPADVPRPAAAVGLAASP